MRTTTASGWRSTRTSASTACGASAILGFTIRAIILIPHFIVLWLIGIAAFVLIAFSWLPVLLLGRQSQLVYSVVGGWMRYGLRVTTYLMLLHDRYPPFSLGNEEADRYQGA